MPTYQYEAMDNTGLEVSDMIDASTEAEAQQLIKEKGFYVTKIQEKGRTKKGKSAAAQKKRAVARRKGKTFSIGGVRSKQLCTFTRQLSTLQDAGLPILRSLRILEGQSKPGPLKNSLMGVIEDIGYRIVNVFGALLIVQRREDRGESATAGGKFPRISEQRRIHLRGTSFTLPSFCLCSL